MVAFRDEDIQRHGAVNVVFFFHAGNDIPIAGGDSDLLWKLPKLNEGSPMRITAIHWCWSHDFWKEQQALLKASFSKPLKVRIRVHHGESFFRCESRREYNIRLLDSNLILFRNALMLFRHCPGMFGRFAGPWNTANVNPGE